MITPIAFISEGRLVSKGNTYNSNRECVCGNRVESPRVESLRSEYRRSHKDTEKAQNHGKTQVMTHCHTLLSSFFFSKKQKTLDTKDNLCHSHYHHTPYQGRQEGKGERKEKKSHCPKKRISPAGITYATPGTATAPTLSASQPTR